MLLDDSALDENSSGNTLKIMTFSFKCYVDYSYIAYSSGNIEV